MSSNLHLQLAEISNLFDRLVSILPLGKWGEVKELKAPLKEEVSRISFSISRRIDALREIIDEKILKEDIDLHNSKKAKTYFNDILPRSDEFSSLWLKASGLDDIELNLDLDLTAKKEKSQKGEVEKEENKWETVWIDTLDFLITWSVERTDGFLEEGGYGDSEIVVPNETYDRAMRLINAKFFNPDVWYDNLQKINPILANPKKIPKDVRFRVGEIHSSLIIGNYLSSVILCRSVLEYCLAKQATKHGINAMWPSGDLKGLGDLVNEYSDRYPEFEIDFRVVKRTGDNSVHSYLSASNVVSLPKVGVGHAFKSWDALRNVLQWLFA